MNNFNNTYFLNYGTFIADLSELKISETEIIENILSKIENKDYSLLFILKIISTINIYLLKEYSFDIVENFYKNLLIKIYNILNKNYDEQILNILIVYLLKDEYTDKTQESLIISLEEIVNNNYSENLLIDDEFWYVLESLKYYLLNLYATYKTYENAPKLRTLINDLKENKEKYDIISLINYK